MPSSLQGAPPLNIEMKYYRIPDTEKPNGQLHCYTRCKTGRKGRSPTLCWFRPALYYVIVAKFWSRAMPVSNLTNLIILAKTSKQSFTLFEIVECRDLPLDPIGVKQGSKLLSYVSHWSFTSLPHVEVGAIAWHFFQHFSNFSRTLVSPTCLLYTKHTQTSQMLKSYENKL